MIGLVSFCKGKLTGQQDRYFDFQNSGYIKKIQSGQDSKTIFSLYKNTKTIRTAGQVF